MTSYRHYDLTYQNADAPDGPELHRIFMTEGCMRAWAEAQFIIPLEYRYVVQEGVHRGSLRYDY